jgi:GT2 family glycosyltransferase
VGLSLQTEVCVVAYRNEDTISALVESLALLGSSVGLAVHDNGPGAATLPVAEAAAASAGIPFRSDACAVDNCGFAAGCNALASGSAATQLMFLNPDARLVHVPADLRAAGRVGGAEVLDRVGNVHHPRARARTLREEVALRWLRRTPAPADGTGYVSGAALLVDRDVFARLGGFDEDYFMYYEDVDLGRRAAAAGVPVVLEPDWQVEHVGGHSVTQSPDGLRTALLRSYESGRRFHTADGRSSVPYDALCAVDAGLRAVAFAALPAKRGSARANRAVARAALRGLVRRSPRP